MKKCLIFIEKNYEKDCMDLLGAAEVICREGFESTALYADACTEEVSGAVDTLIRLPETLSFDVQNLAAVIAGLHRKNSYDCILIAATQFGRMLAPYAAALLECGLVADVTALNPAEEGIEMIRPAFGGRIMAVVKKTGEGPVMMSVRPGVFFYEPGPEKNTKLASADPALPEKGRIRLLEKRQKPQRKDIRESKVLVSGGAGAMNDFALLSELAERLHGAVSASRMAVDNGKADRMIQVGQSGRFVRPKLYIAEGIYGAIQHVAGIRQAEQIIAVNTDPQAPICSLADIVVEADAADFTRKLIERIDRDLNETEH